MPIYFPVEYLICDFGLGRAVSQLFTYKERVIYGVILTVFIGCKSYPKEGATSSIDESIPRDILLESKQTIFDDFGFLIDWEQYAFRGESKARHKLRSFISYAVQSRCFLSPNVHGSFKSKPNLQPHRLEKRWQDRYDYNYYQRGSSNERGNGKEYVFKIRIAPDRLCSAILGKIAELTHDQIDLQQSNLDFFKHVMDNNAKSPTSEAMATQAQMFFREILADQIITNIEQTMARAKLLFPFYRNDYIADCIARRDWWGDWGQGKEYRYNKDVRDKINCQALRQLPRAEISKSFVDLKDLTNGVIEVIDLLNMHRQTLDEIVKEKVVVEPKTLGPGTIERSRLKNVEKKKFFFWDILNETNLKNPLVLEAYDDYTNVLLESAKSGILPLLFTSSLQRKAGSLHLNHAGRFFGFGKVEYKPLHPPDQGIVKEALVELIQELIDSWVELQVLKLSETIDERTLYNLIISYEIATAQVIMQSPKYSLLVTYLIRKFQHEPIVPKWIRTYKNVAMAADLAFIPIMLLGGFVTGGATVPILLMANAVNFLWVGVASSELVTARNRYRLVERALFTGNSENVIRNLEMLKGLHDKKRNFLMSAGVGAPLTIGNLGAIYKGLDGKLATMVVDIGAALTSDVEAIAQGDDKSSDADIQKRLDERSAE